MFRSSRSTSFAAVAAVALAMSLGLAACGGGDADDEDSAGATKAVAGTTYPSSEVCKLLPLEVVQRELPGAKVDTSLPSSDSCFYAADAGDVILTRLRPRDFVRGPGAPDVSEFYDMLLSDATDNGAKDVRNAQHIGVDGKIAVNSTDSELTAVWRRGGDVYSVQYSSWDGSAADASDIAERLAKAVR